MTAVAAKPAAGSAMNPTAMVVGVVLLIILLVIAAVVSPGLGLMALIGVIIGGVLIGFGVHFVPVGGAPAAMGQAPGIATGVAMLAAGAGLAGLFGGAWAAGQGFAIAIITGGIGGGMTNGHHMYDGELRLRLWYGYPCSIRQGSKGPNHRGHELNTNLRVLKASFRCLICGRRYRRNSWWSWRDAHLSRLLNLYQATLPTLMNASAAQVLPIAVSVAGTFAIGMFLENAVLTAYNITGTIEGPHDPKFKRWPRAIVASAVASALCGLVAILIVITI